MMAVPDSQTLLNLSVSNVYFFRCRPTLKVSSTSLLVVAGLAALMLATVVSAELQPCASGRTCTYAGARSDSGSMRDSTNPLIARFRSPFYQVFDDDSKMMYLSDRGNDRIRSVNLTSHAVSTVFIDPKDASGTSIEWPYDD